MIKDLLEIKNDPEILNTSSVVNGTSDRWWLQVNIGDFKIGALYYPGTTRTILGSVGVGIASALKATVQLAYGPGVRMAN